MLTVATDLLEIKGGFLSTPSITGHCYLSERDFHNWVMASIDFLGLLVVDFDHISYWSQNYYEFSEPVTNYSQIHDLYQQLVILLDCPHIRGREVFRCFGQFKGDLLCFHMEFLND